MLHYLQKRRDHGLVQMDSTSESYPVQVVEEGVIRHAPNVGSINQDLIVFSVLESSLFKVKEDDEVDNLEIKVDATRKSKRIYRTPTPEVSLKISRSLRSLNAKTGLFSKRMKIIHQDPVLHAQRVAAIKKTKGTPAARKQASEISKAYFSDPANRLKRSMAMRGVKFYCSHCGEEGHRKHYCPELRRISSEMRFICSSCGERGHNRRTCERRRRTTTKKKKKAKSHQSRPQHCNLCGRSRHYWSTLPKAKRSYSCMLCLRKGHNSRTCPSREGTEETKTNVVLPEQQTI